MGARCKGLGGGARGWKRARSVSTAAATRDRGGPARAEALSADGVRMQLPSCGRRDGRQEEPQTERKRVQRDARLGLVTRRPPVV
eukprot:974643-Pleurochrysis_carterae.AAC.1